MIDAMLDVLLGHFWRTFVSLYTGSFAWFVVPLTAWMVLMIVARRAPAVAESRIRAALRALGADGGRLSGAALVARLQPEVVQVALHYRLMPSPSGFWVRRCDPEQLARVCNLNPKSLAEMRDEVLHVSRAPGADRTVIKAKAAGR